MKWHLSDMHWTQRMHLPRVHAVHLHPVHWFATHPIVLALLIAGLIAATIIGLAQLTDRGIRIDTLDHGYGLPVMYPYSGAY